MVACISAALSKSSQLDGDGIDTLCFTLGANQNTAMISICSRRPLVETQEVLEFILMPWKLPIEQL